MTRGRLDSYLLSLISYLYLALLFFLPLLFSMKSSEVFEFPKMLFVYAMTTLIVACWIARMIVNRKFIYTKTPLDVPLYLYLSSQILSTLFSIDFHTSLFGYYSRWNGGFLSTLAYTMLYAAYTSNPPLRRGMQTEKGPTLRQDRTLSDTALFGYSVHRLLRYSILASATIVSMYAVLQRMGIDRDLWVQDVVARVFSMQGQPNWLAAYLVMMIPLAWATSMNNEQRTKNSVLSLFSFFFFLFALVFTRSRSGLLGMVVADVVFWSLLFLKRSDLGIRRGQTFSGSRLWRSFLIAHCFLFIVFSVTNNSAREWIVKKFQVSNSNPQTQLNSPTADYSLLTTSDITPSSDIRKIVWRGALELVKQRPFFGWGPETFAYTYWRVRPIEHNQTSEWNFLYNKAHNEWLNLAANTGLFGLGTHLILLVWFAWWSVLAISRITNHESRITIAALLAAILGVESVNVFGFSTVTTQAYSYIFMGMAIAERTRAKGQGTKEDEESNSSFSLQPLALSLIVLLTSLYLLSQLFFLFFADLSYNRGKQFAKAGYLPEALTALDAAVNLVPNEPVFRSELAETQGVFAVSLALSDVEGFAAAASLKDSSLDNFRIVGKQSPVNVSLLRTRARITHALGSLDPSLNDQGIELMKHAVDLAPTDPKIPYNLGVMLQDRGRTDEAKLSFEKALELKPDYEEAKRALENIGN